MPLHEPPHTVPSEVQGLRPVMGAPLTAVQVPRLAVRLQASHWPVHWPSQQYPSTQNPEEHWFQPVQATPLPSLLWQWPVASQ